MVGTITTMEQDGLETPNFICTIDARHLLDWNTRSHVAAPRCKLLTLIGMRVRLKCHSNTKHRCDRDK